MEFPSIKCNCAIVSRNVSPGVKICSVKSCLEFTGSGAPGKRGKQEVFASSQRGASEKPILSLGAKNDFGPLRR